MVIVCPIDYDDWTMAILIWMMRGWGREKDGGGISHRVVNENNMKQGLELLYLTKHKMLWYVVPVIEGFIFILLGLLLL